MDSWPEEDVTTLRKLVADGMRTCHIVEEFKGRYQRGAIVGKIRRLKLPKVARTSSLRRSGAKIVKLSDLGRPSVSVYSLTSLSCRRVMCDEHDQFIRNEKNEIQYCGQLTEPGKPYCEPCDTLINNPSYGANAGREKSAPLKAFPFHSRRLAPTLRG